MSKPYAGGCEGQHPDEDGCHWCVPVGTFGMARVGDWRFMGGLVGASTGLRHDPLVHAADCPLWRMVSGG